MDNGGTDLGGAARANILQKARAALPLIMPTATSNRPPVGHRCHPYGWSARQAAQLAGIPARTVQQWAADGLVAPTYTNPALGITSPSTTSAT